MYDPQKLAFHPLSEKIVKVICDKTQKDSPKFFRVLVAYQMCMMASNMRCSINTHDRGNIPVNAYALSLGTSGSGKGHSMNIMETEVIKLFRDRFVDYTFPTLAEINLPKLALKRSNHKGTDPDEELADLQREFTSAGKLAFKFDQATVAAVRQQRHKLLLADGGALNLQIDEIGSNLTGSIEELTKYLELYDVGMINPNLIKNTQDNKRNEEIVGRTPANLMMMGTPSKLLNGGKTEDELNALLDTGYSRRCFFAYGRSPGKATQMTPEEVYAITTNSANTAFLEGLANKFEALADIININKKLIISKPSSLLLISYRLHCEREADKLNDNEEMRKAEMSHRYYKALKLAGAYAFVDESPEVTEQHLYNAFALAEESGQAFAQLLARDKSHVKLAKYIATVNGEVTQADLVEDLPFYKGGSAQKNEMLALAIAYGYKNNIIIKKSYSDGIEFLKGETLKLTDIEKTILSYSTDLAVDYSSQHAPFDQLHKLTQAEGLHWTSHHHTGGHRSEDSTIAGFNLVVLDVDGGAKISTAKELLKNYKYHLYTTKRHTEEENRFRIVMPLNYELKLDAKDYKEFMSNIYEWLPFKVDDQTNQRARKWLSHKGHFEYNDGEMLDALPFIPKTSKNEERKRTLTTQSSLDNLERWVLNNSGDGNRNNMLLRYGMMLVDAGHSFDSVRSKVMALNDKMPDKLQEIEIIGTIMVTIGKAIANRP